MQAEFPHRNLDNQTALAAAKSTTNLCVKGLLLASLLLGCASTLMAETPATEVATPSKANHTQALPALPETAKRLSPDTELWVDADNSVVYINAEVVLRKGVLEMFACPKGTKEHESVVAVDSPAFLIHTALLAIGAEPGKPVQFSPKFVPPSGEEIEIKLEWLDEAGKLQTARAQDWIRNLDTKKAMDLPFVFAGSGFWTNPDTQEQRYLAESGDLICVSNFGSAMLDIPIESSQSNEGLLFEPFTEQIPAEETPIRMILFPIKKK